MLEQMGQHFPFHPGPSVAVTLMMLLCCCLQMQRLLGWAVQSSHVVLPRSAHQCAVLCLQIALFLVKNTQVELTLAHIMLNSKRLV